MTISYVLADQEVKLVFRRRTDAPPQCGPQLRLTARGFTNPERGCGDCASKRRDQAEGWATGLTDAMAQAVALLPSATAVTTRGRDQAPSDDQREERRVNPLLYALAVHMSHLPRMANETVLALRLSCARPFVE